MTKNEILRRRVSALVADGALPSYPTNPTVAAGVADGSPCVVCDKLIGPGHVQYEFEDSARRLLLRMHSGCFVAWRSVCTGGRAEHREHRP